MIFKRNKTLNSEKTVEMPDGKPRGVLTILSGPMANTTVEIRDGETIYVGRNAADCKLALPQGYPPVSRVHCAVSFDAAARQFRVTDLSTNGTSVVTGKGKSRLAKDQPAPVFAGAQLWLAEGNCKIGLAVRETPAPATGAEQTVENLLETLILRHHASPKAETFAAVLEHLRTDPQVWVPMTAQMSPEDQAQFLNAKPGQQVSTKGQIRMKPDTLQKDGQLFFPVFSAKEEAPEQYRNNFSWMQMSFLNCVKMTMGSEKLSAIVINAFSKNLVLNKEVLQLLVSDVVQDHMVEKGTVIKLEPAGPQAEKLKRLAVQFLRKTASRRAYLAKMTNKGEESYLFAIDTGNLEPRAFFQKMHMAMAAAKPDLPVDYVPYAAVKAQILASPCRMIYQQYGVKDEKYPLDDHNFAYLRAHFDEDGQIGAYSLDFEKADDSHYTYSADEALKLEAWVQKLFGDTPVPDALRWMVQDAQLPNENQVEAYLVGLLQKLGVDYQEFHFY